MRKSNDSIKKILNSLLEECGINQCEIFGNKISISSLRDVYFKEFAKHLIANRKSENLFDQFNELELSEAKKWYLINWVDSIEMIALNVNFTKALICLCENQIELIEILLQCFAVKKVLFKDLPEDGIRRFNRTLNIQWAIDIKNSMNVN